MTVTMMIKKNGHNGSGVVIMVTMVMSAHLIQLAQLLQVRWLGSEGRVSRPDTNDTDNDDGDSIGDDDVSPPSSAYQPSPGDVTRIWR